MGGGGGVDCAHNFFRRLFLHEKRGLEVPNFLTFPNSKRCGHNQPLPHSRRPPHLGILMKKWLNLKGDPNQTLGFYQKKTFLTLLSGSSECCLMKGEWLCLHFLDHQIFSLHFPNVILLIELKGVERPICASTIGALAVRAKFFLKIMQYQERQVLGETSSHLRHSLITYTHPCTSL